MFCEDINKWQALNIKSIKVSQTSGILITPFLLTASRAVVQCWNSLFGFRKNVFDWKCITMLLHKEYYTIVLCYTGYWWQQTSRLLYVQSWKIHKKRSADHRRGKHFFLSFPTCLFTTLKRIRGAGGICQTDSHSHFDKVLRWEHFTNLTFGLVLLLGIHICKNFPSTFLESWYLEHRNFYFSHRIWTPRFIVCM